MLSVASVRSAAGAASYFAKDDYRAAEYYAGAHASERSQWGGEGAKALGLAGKVSREAFERILTGVQPGGAEVGMTQQRQAGIDLTFSMPKSASILAYVAGDERVLNAHWAAVAATMRWAEEVFAEGRSYARTRSGEPVRTGNLVYALFQHDTSRALDPQGHIHAVVANMTRMADGTWRALHNGQLWKNNSVIGAAYHAQLREELARLGYQTRLTGKHGQFEIRGVPDAVLAEFSQRRLHILEKAAQLGIGSPKGLDQVTINTRNPKLRVEDRTALRESWQSRAAALGFDGKALVAEATARARSASVSGRISTRDRLNEIAAGVREALGTAFAPHDPLVSQGAARLLIGAAEYRTQHAVASAVRILEQREAAFSVAQLGKTALDLGLAGVTAGRVDARISELVRQEKLIPGKSERIDAAMTHVTTPGALATEADILAQIEAGKGASRPIVPAGQAAARLTQAAGARPLTAGQMAAATLALSSSDRIVAVQGVAGAGKSTMIASVARLAAAQGHRVLGLAFQNKMVGDLKAEAGIAAQTVSSFVATYARHALAGKGEGFETARNTLKGTVLILDEASMIGSAAMRHLVRIANALSVDRLVLVGDRQQLSAIDAGKSFALAQAGGIGLARMDENLRQRTDQLRQVAALANRGAVREALGVLGDQFRAASDHLGAAASHWLGLNPDERERTALFASGRAARAELNTSIQDGLKADGTLVGAGRTLSVLERVNATPEELRYPHIYQPGQTLEVARAVRAIGLRPGSYSVLGVDLKGRVELLVGSRVHRFDPQKIDPLDRHQPLALSRSEDVTLHAGDQIRWTRNDKGRGLDNAARARVVSVDPDTILVEAADKSLHELRNGDPMLQRLGLAYALNMHMAQGVTADRGIAVMSSAESNLANQRLFNVTVTRVRDELTLYTDNTEKLTRAIERNEGNKTSALETIGSLSVDGAASPPRGSGPAPRASAFGPAALGQPLRLAELASPALPARQAEPAKDLPFPEKDIGLEL